MNLLRLCLLLLTILIASSPLLPTAMAVTNAPDKIETFIYEQMDASKIPGLAVVIVNGDRVVYERGFGYSDLEKQRPVTRETVFELGSNTKAYTALAVLQLEQQGRLKLKDPVSKYLPWFTVTLGGQPVEITLEQLLYHKSGLPPETVGLIPRSSSDDALEQWVRKLSGIELKPAKGTRLGERFEYATANYDILGLVIQTVSGIPYEEYMQRNVLQPLGLDHTYANYEDAVRNGLSAGYKMGFTYPLAYEAPRYRGNVPAGYISASMQDVAEWMKIQLGTKKINGFGEELIRRSHAPDTTVPPSSNGSSYAAGWSVFQRGSGELSHGGENPAFSSFMVLRPGDKIGIAVLANMNSDYTEYIARSLLDLIQDRELVKPQKDQLDQVDKIATLVLAVMVPTALALLVFQIRAVREIGSGVRKFTGFRGKEVRGALLSGVFLGLFLLGFYWLPNILFERLPWGEVSVWGPQSLLPAVLAMIAVGVQFFLYHLLILFFPKSMEKLYPALILLGIVSGFGNAFIIFVINQTFGNQDNLTNGLLFYFVLGIIMYVCGQRYIRTKLVTMTNNLVYEKRTDMIQKILRTPFYKMEAIADGRMHAVLNNDTEVVSRSMNVLVGGLTSLVTLICCFLYLGLLNGYALFISMAVIALAAGLYFYMGNKAEKLWEETRDIQTTFFRLMNDLIKGFKELRLNHHRNLSFRDQMEKSCDAYRWKRTEGDVRFASVTVIGELLFTVVIGFVAFLFPLIFPHIQAGTLQVFVFVFLYMTGPVNGILMSYPTFVQIRISWKRIQELSEEIANLNAPNDEDLYIPNGQEPVELVMRGVSYKYAATDGSAFGVGPIDLTFRSGSITFLTGGNGSGKTTLAKLLTGLYVPQEGFVLVNGESLSSEQLSQYFSAIFSDYYLFDRLYGIYVKGQEAKIEELLSQLELSEKVAVVDGRFTTTSLSTGQKKRLALLLSYLEDRPICLFDEWAADQDPEYRRHFYDEILPRLKEQGKCVIAITHDDRYFHMADQHIKLEMGRVVEYAGQNPLVSL
ncbi:cyclic peptide export ABC transporter [Brevibacillus brevis]|uniref:cyclic peptide export ABC transporter n=1 Tax=Brevibacillus brevis TaxID=1393 RepID=UPI000E369356|nr:cyclic peptide export ABC transporter [Brevibacillus brevis]RED35860.1 putative ATP-binding cassette transporter [Brevibacillus brevis]GEC88345.1 hypothetical protein BBR01nite_06760 [Brevibacillus brevis]VEF89030.1 ABC transporter ATP-binding protein YojI [Brevibacillus brevis]